MISIWFVPRLSATLFIVALLPTGISHGGNAGIQFVYQPLTTHGGEMDAGIIIAKVPVLANAVPESVLASIALPNRLPQDLSYKVEDSNILSRASIALKVEWVPSSSRYVVDIDITRMVPLTKMSITAEQTVAAAIECVRRTVVNSSYFRSRDQVARCEVRIISQPSEVGKWQKYNQVFETKEKATSFEPTFIEGKWEKAPTRK